MSYSSDSDSDYDANRGTLFVMYTRETEDELDWKYKREIPAGWEWVGSGTAEPLNSTRTVKYELEMQYGGPIEKRTKMRAYLKKNFDNFKKQGIVKHFKIVNKFMRQ